MLLLAWNRKLSQPSTWWNSSLEQEAAKACSADEIEVKK